MENYMERLKKLRKAHGFSIGQISEYLKCDYSRIESGEDRLYLSHLGNLSNLYNCSHDYILCRRDDFDYGSISEVPDLNAYAKMNETARYLRLLRKIEQM